VENVKSLVDKNIPPVEKYENNGGKNCLKTEMHRLVAMHLRIG